MVQVFRDCCLRALRQSGSKGMLKLWALTLFDLLRSSIEEHLQKETQMKKEMKPEDIRMAGSALMIGAATFAIAMLAGYVGDAINVDLWMWPSILTPFICMPLFLVGMLALRSRYGEKVGGVANNILLITAVLGTITSVAGIFLAGIGEFWLLVFTGPAILFTGLTFFGVASLYKKPLSRWNILPLLAGLWYPIFFFSQSQLSILVTGEPYLETVNTFSAELTMALIMLQAGALFMLGYILKSDVPEEIPAIA
jgi:peptidoglycan/LPS O-acetylase OafA/YrhL